MAGLNGGVNVDDKIKTLEIPVNAEVHCIDGTCGRCIYVIVNPTTQKITHLVVKQEQFPNTPRLVPLLSVQQTEPDSIQLSCTRDGLAAMDRFVEIEYIPGVVPYFRYGPGEYMMWPYVSPEPMVMPIEHKRIPPGELAVRRGAQVTATDGAVGQVDEFIVDPTDGHITHLVLREGHLWGQKDVTIPISQIDRIEANNVYLKLDKQSIEALPAVPVRRGIWSLRI